MNTLLRAESLSELCETFVTAFIGNLQKMVRGFQLEAVFDFVFGIDDTLGTSKVYRGHELLTMSGVDRDRTILVGDTDHDLEVGRTLGIPVVLVARGHQSTARLRSVHDTVLE